MKKQIHPNFIKSSNLIFVSAGLASIGIFFSDETLNDQSSLTFSVLSILFVFGLGFLIRRGIDWARYLFLSLLVFGVLAIPMIISNIMKSPIDALLYLVQYAIQIWAVTLLFKFGVKKRSVEENPDLR